MFLNILLALQPLIHLTEHNVVSTTFCILVCFLTVNAIIDHSILYIGLGKKIEKLFINNYFF